jgi:hypothetical protein
MARSLACRLGLHRYRWVGPPGKQHSYRACTRCGKRHRVYDIPIEGTGASAADFRSRMGLDDPPDTYNR